MDVHGANDALLRHLDAVVQVLNQLHRDPFFLVTDKRLRNILFHLPTESKNLDPNSPQDEGSLARESELIEGFTAGRLFSSHHAVSFQFELIYKVDQMEWLHLFLSERLRKDITRETK